MGLGVGGGIVAEDEHDDNDADELCGFFCLKLFFSRLISVNSRMRIESKSRESN